MSARPEGLIDPACTHHECRCARAAELAEMADRRGDIHLLAGAVLMLADANMAVRCRRATARRRREAQG